MCTTEPELICTQKSIIIMMTQRQIPKKTIMQYLILVYLMVLR